MATEQNNEELKNTNGEQKKKKKITAVFHKQNSAHNSLKSRPGGAAPAKRPAGTRPAGTAKRPADGRTPVKPGEKRVRPAGERPARPVRPARPADAANAAVKPEAAAEEKIVKTEAPAAEKEDELDGATRVIPLGALKQEIAALHVANPEVTESLEQTQEAAALEEAVEEAEEALAEEAVEAAVEETFEAPEETVEETVEEVAVQAEEAAQEAIEEAIEEAAVEAAEELPLDDGGIVESDEVEFVPPVYIPVDLPPYLAPESDEIAAPAQEAEEMPLPGLSDEAPAGIGEEEEAAEEEPAAPEKAE